MAITVDTTVGGASANSYITVQEFKDFLAIRSNVPASISEATDDTLAKWLLQACREIDLHAFKGVKYVTGIDADGNPEQALEFPRNYTYSTNGGYIPQNVKYAQCEQALEIARFEANTPVWTQRTVDLPEPTPTYYIAFEGHTTYGYGVCIDDIQITGDFSPYLNWQANYFSEAELAEGVITADDDDPDGDGIPNALEFAMGFDPRVPDTEGLPFGGVTAGYLTLSFRMDKDALAAGVIFEVEACTDLLLQDWSTLDISEQIPRADSNTWYQALFWHDVPVTNAPQRFMRFKVYMP